MGCHPTHRENVERDIIQYINLPEGLALRGRDGYIIPAKNFWKKTKHFCKVHKTEIIIGVVVVALVITVVMISTSTGGVAAGSAAAAAGKIIEGIANSSEDLQVQPSKILDSSLSNSIFVEKSDLLELPYTQPSSFMQTELLSPLSNESQSSLALSGFMNNEELPNSNLPWVNESISYLQWREQQLSKELLASILSPSTAAFETTNQFQKTDPAFNSPDETRALFFENHPSAQAFETNEWAYEEYKSSIRALQAERQKEDIQTLDNYASKAYNGCYTNDYSSKPPFQEIQLLGYPDQSTIHFHCGINNEVATIWEGGACLNDQLKEEFAIQPHLVHPHGMIKGLSMVGLEKLDEHKNNPVTQLVFGPGLPQIAGSILQHTDIQKSIDYEVENLSKIAQSIIEINNPKLKQVHVTFSNGGYVFNEALKQLPPEYRETIVVITAGTTKIIDGELACEVHNVIGDKDWPSQVCNGGEGGIENAKSKANIYIIEQTETDGMLGGHYFVQPDYQGKISDIIKDQVVGKYEVY